MVKILYKGDISPCNVSVKSGKINRWKRGEVKDVNTADAEDLLVQTYFVRTEGNYKEEKSKKVEKVIEPVKEKEEYISFDYENALKDQLLDYTARHDIEADYSNTVKELKELIKKYLEEKEDNKTNIKEEMI